MKGMPRRVVTYATNLVPLNRWVSINAFLLGLSMLVFVANAVYSLVLVRRPAEHNPWRSKSLEWQTATPVPVNNFEKIPVIDSDPYDYGTPVGAHAGEPLPAGG
jgi:cytochrome c oxidase subunit 1